MAHLEQRDFLSRVKKLFPENFFSVKVLDIGSFNVTEQREISLVMQTLQD